MVVVRNESGFEHWICSRCKWVCARPAGSGMPTHWKELAGALFCEQCVGWLERNTQPRAPSSWSDARRSDPAGQDKGAGSSPSGPRRERVAVFVLLAFAAAAFVVAIAVTRHLFR